MSNDDYKHAQVRVVRAERPNRGTPQLVEENMRIERTVLRAAILPASVRMAFGTFVAPLLIERFYNDKGVLKAERAGFA